MAVRLERDELIQAVRLTPLVSIDLIVKNNVGQILLGLRDNEPARDYWFVPGGRIGKGERIAAAFRRISAMELGREFTMHDARFLGVYEHIYEENFVRQPGFGTHYVVLSYELSLSAPLINLPADQHRDYQWLLPGQILGASDVHPYTKAYFESS